MIAQYTDPNDRADQGRRNKSIQRAAPRSAIHDYRAATAERSALSSGISPVGLQITGEEDDPTTIEAAHPLAIEIDGLVPPPDYR